MRQVIVNGLLLGSQYALLAVGYTLVFGVTRLLTLAHGEIFMVSALVSVAVLRATDAPLVVGILVAAGVGTSLGVATDLLCFRPVPRGVPFAPAVATLGFGMAMQGVVVVVHGSDPLGLPSGLSAVDFRVGSVVLSGVQLVALVLAVVLMAGVHAFVYRTRWGMAMRAMGESPGSVSLIGISPKALATATLAVSGLLAGISGILVALRVGSVSPFIGMRVGLIGLAIMTIGGVGSLRGATVAGLMVGITEVLAGYYGLGGFEPAVPWVLVIVALLARPKRLAGMEAEGP